MRLFALELGYDVIGTERVSRGWTGFFRPVRRVARTMTETSMPLRISLGLFINNQLYRFSERLTRRVNLSEKSAANFSTVL